MFQQTPNKRVLFPRTLMSVVMGLFVVAAILGGIFMSFPGKAAAATNGSINFQARLEGPGGSVAADGYYNIGFALYDAPSGGNLLWTETYYDTNGVAAGGDARIKVVNGYVSVPLGQFNTFPSTINWDQPLYLTMNVGGTTQTATPTYDGEMLPRLALGAVPYAFRAGQLAASNAAGTLTSTLSILQPTVGSQTFQIADQAAAGTYTLCVQGAANAQGGCAASTGSTSYIQNRNSSAQTSTNFWIGGTGRADTALQAPSFDTPTAVALNIGTTNATSVTVGKAGVNTLIGGNLSVGTTQSLGAITVANGTWFTSVDAAGTGVVNMFSVNSANQIQVGAALSVDGGIILPTNGGQLTLSDLPIDSTATAGTKESYTLRVGSSNALTVYGEADGSGNAQNLRVAIGSSISPAYTLDVGGDINTSGAIRTAGTTVVSAAGILQSASLSGTYGSLTGVGTLTAGTWNASTIGVQYGGTGLASYTIGDLLYASGTTTIGKLTAVASGSCLKSAGVGAAPAWGSCSTGGVTLQGSTPGTPDTGNINVTGTIVGGTALQAPLLDTASAVALNIGTTNATVINLNENVTVAAGKSLALAGGITSTRPSSPTEGMLYYDTSIKQLLTYANGKWQADRSSSTKIVGQAGSSLGVDGADYLVASGSTSAQTTINSALTSLGSTGGTVYLMEGTYVTSGAISIPSNVTLAGAGDATIIQLAAATNTSFGVITNSDTTNGNSRIGVRDLKIDGNKASVAGGSQNGFTLTKVGSGTGSTAVPGARINNVTIENMNNYGVLMTTSLNSTLDHLNITNPTNAGVNFASAATNNILTNSAIAATANHGVVLTGGNNTIDDNTITSSSIYGIIILSGSAGNTISGNTLASNSSGGMSVAGNNNTISSNTATGSAAHGFVVAAGTKNTFTGNTANSNGNQGFQIQSTSDGNTFTGNTASNNSGAGFSVNTSSNNAFTGNNMAGNATFGIVLTTAANSNVVSGNKIHDNGVGGNSPAVDVISSNNNSITGNDISDTSGTSPGITISSSASSATYLSNNTFSGTITGISDSGTGTIYSGQLNSSGVLLHGGAGSVFKNNADSTTAFQIQNAAGNSLLTADTTNMAINVNNGQLNVLGLNTPVPTLATTGTTGTLTAATYYYRVAAFNTSGHSIAAATTPTSVTTSGTTSKNTVSWSQITGATGYYVYRSTDGTNWYQNTIAGGSTVTAVDNGTNFTWSGTVTNTFGDAMVVNTTGSLTVNASGAVNFGSSSARIFGLGADLLVQNTNPNGTVALQGDSFTFQDTVGFNNNLLMTNTGATTFKNRVNSATAFQIQNASAAPLFGVDTTTNNLVTNPDFDTDVTTGWSAVTATLTRNTTAANNFNGPGSMSVNVTTAAGGASLTGFTTAIVPGAYALSFYAKNSTVAGSLSVTLTGGGAPACTIANTTSLTTVGFRQYVCFFTSTTTNVTAIKIASSTTGLFYLDGVQLTASANGSAFVKGGLSLNGVINSPVILQGTTNSASALQVRNSGGKSIFAVNTADSKVEVGDVSSSATPNYLYVSDLSNNTAGNASVVGNWQSTNNWGIGSNSNANDSTIRLGITTQNTNTWNTAQNLNALVAGTLTVTPTTGNDSITAFQIQNAAGTSLFNADSTGSYVINNGTAAAGNLLENPGFEAGSATMSAAGWYAPGASGSIVTDAANAYSGNRELQIAGGTGDDVLSYKYYAVQPGQKIYYEGYVKHSAGGSGTGGFYVTAMDKDRANPVFSTGDIWADPGTTYSRRSNTYTVPAGKYFIRVAATTRSGSVGTWYFDDLYLKLASEQAPMTFQNSVDSATAFQIQNAAGTSNLFMADTFNGRIGIGQTPSASGSTLQVTGGITATSGGIIAATSDINAAAGSIQTAGNTRITNGGNLQNIGTISATGFITQSSGQATFRNVTNSSTGFQIQNANADSILNVDTTLGDITTSGGNLNIMGPTPVAPSIALASGGTLTNGTTYMYRLAGSTSSGLVTLAINSSPASVTATSTNKTVNISWTAIPGMANYYLYRSSDGGNTWYRNTIAGGSTVSAVDNGTNFTWSGTNYDYQADSSSMGVFVRQGNHVYLDQNHDASIYEKADGTLSIENYSTLGTTSFAAHDFNFFDTTGFHNNFNINDFGQTTFSNRTDTANAFQIQNASADNILKADTLNSNVVLGAAGVVNAWLQFNNATNTNTVSLHAADGTAAYDLQLPSTAPAVNQCLAAGATTASNLTWTTCSGGGSGVTTVGTFTGASIANGASISGSTITFGAAGASNPGLVTTGAQTFAGAKTFSSAVVAPGLQNAGTLALAGTGASGAVTLATNGSTRVTLDSAGGFTYSGGVFALQAAAANRLLFDTSNSILKVYDSGGSGVYASISASSTGATFAASSGTTTIGSGSGNVTSNLTGVNDLFSFTKTYTAAAAYGNTDFTIQRAVTGGANTLTGAVLKIEDVSSATTAANIQPSVLLVNQSNASATGYLFNAQSAGVSKVTIANSGAVNIVSSATAGSFSSNTYDGSAGLTIGTSSATSITIGKTAITTALLGTVRVGTSTDNMTFSSTTGEPTLNGNARHARHITLAAEYAGATMTPDGSSNTGTMTSDSDTTSPFRNYYQWANTAGTAQDYDIWVRVPLPSDFGALPSGETICIDTYASATTANGVKLTLYGTNNTVVGTSFDLTPTSTSTWQNKCTTSITGGTFAADGIMNLDIKLTAPATTGIIRIGDISFDYLSRW